MSAETKAKLIANTAAQLAALYALRSLWTDGEWEAVKAAKAEYLALTGTEWVLA